MNEFRTKLNRSLKFRVFQREYATADTVSCLDDGDCQAGIRQCYSSYSPAAPAPITSTSGFLE